MSFSSEEEARIDLIETTLNKMINWLRNVPSRNQWRQMVLNQQNTITELDNRITILEGQMTTIINRLDAIPDIRQS